MYLYALCGSKVNDANDNKRKSSCLDSVMHWSHSVSSPHQMWSGFGLTYMTSPTSEAAGHKCACPRVF